MKIVVASEQFRRSIAWLNDFSCEIELTRQNKQLMEMLAWRAKQTKTVPLKEAKAQLGLD